jgi:hypothetical protein
MQRIEHNRIVTEETYFIQQNNKLFRHSKHDRHIVRSTLDPGLMILITAFFNLFNTSDIRVWNDIQHGSII